ncbi:hypothetical protein MASR1M32_32980 [Rhodobacter sp.]
MRNGFFTPVSGLDLPRFAGVPTFMRLPYVAPGDARLQEVDVGLIGAPGMAARPTAPGRGTGRASCATCRR